MATANENLKTYMGIVQDKAIKESKTGNEFVVIEILQENNTTLTARAWDEVPIADLKAVKVDQSIVIGCRDAEVKDNPGSFYHNIMWVNVVNVDEQPAQQATTPAATPQTNPTDWTHSTRLQIAWNSAVNNAVNAEPAHDIVSAIAKPLHIWLDLVGQRANGLYSLILRGPTSPEPEVEPEVEVDNDPEPTDGVLVV